MKYINYYRIPCTPRSSLTSNCLFTHKYIRLLWNTWIIIAFFDRLRMEQIFSALSFLDGILILTILSLFHVSSIEESTWVFA